MAAYTDNPFTIATNLVTYLGTVSGATTATTSSSTSVATRPLVIVQVAGSANVPWGLDGVSVKVGGTEVGGVNIKASKYITGQLDILCIAETGNEAHTIAAAVSEKLKPSILDLGTSLGVTTASMSGSRGLQLLQNNKDYVVVVELTWGILARYV